MGKKKHAELIAEESPAVEAQPEATAEPVKIPWRVWMHGDSPARHNPLIVQAISRDDAWSQFCEANKLPLYTPGPRVIRPALDSELPQG